MQHHPKGGEGKRHHSKKGEEASPAKKEKAAQPNEGWESSTIESSIVKKGCVAAVTCRKPQMADGPLPHAPQDGQRVDDGAQLLGLSVRMYLRLFRLLSVIGKGLEFS